MNLLTVLKQQQNHHPCPLEDEATVLADFFTFLKDRGVDRETKVVLVANSVDLLPLLQHKAVPCDLAMVKGMKVV
jgi:predicted SnoaL-like aldol condensation-catalyzing enzyme